MNKVQIGENGVCLCIFPTVSGIDSESNDDVILPRYTERKAQTLDPYIEDTISNNSSNNIKSNK